MASAVSNVVLAIVVVVVLLSISKETIFSSLLKIPISLSISVSSVVILVNVLVPVWSVIDIFWPAWLINSPLVNVSQPVMFTTLSRSKSISQAFVALLPFTLLPSTSNITENGVPLFAGSPLQAVNSTLSLPLDPTIFE